MILFLICTYTLRFVAVSAAPTLPSLALPTTSPLQLPTFRGHCVDDRKFPEWYGNIDSNDCYPAQFNLESSVPSMLSNKYTFWSRALSSGATPPPNGWELPEASSFQSCIVLIQITKEFGNDTVPFYQGQYLPTVRLPESVQTTWENVIGALAAVRLQCVKLRKQPGWTDIEGVGGRKAAIVLLIPARSEMAMDWASIALRNGNSKVDATNATASS